MWTVLLEKSRLWLDERSRREGRSVFSIRSRAESEQFKVLVFEPLSNSVSFPFSVDTGYAKLPVESERDDQKSSPSSIPLNGIKCLSLFVWRLRHCPVLIETGLELESRKRRKRDEMTKKVPLHPFSFPFFSKSLTLLVSASHFATTQTKDKAWWTVAWTVLSEHWRKRVDEKNSGAESTRTLRRMRVKKGWTVQWTCLPRFFLLSSLSLFSSLAILPIQNFLQSRRGRERKGLREREHQTFTRHYANELSGLLCVLQSYTFCPSVYVCLTFSRKFPHFCLPPLCYAPRNPTTTEPNQGEERTDERRDRIDEKRITIKNTRQVSRGKNVRECSHSLTDFILEGAPLSQGCWWCFCPCSQDLTLHW